MNTTDTSEAGLETLIVRSMTGDLPTSTGVIRDAPRLYSGTGWLLGHWKDYDRDYAVDLKQLAVFLESTQPKVAEAIDLTVESPARQKFLARYHQLDVVRKLLGAAGTEGAGRRYLIQHSSECELLRVHRDPEEPDAGDLR
jgi:type I restriction enzyme R subunit